MLGYGKNLPSWPQLKGSEQSRDKFRWRWPTYIDFERGSNHLFHESQWRHAQAILHQLTQYIGFLHRNSSTANHSGFVEVIRNPFTPSYFHHSCVQTRDTYLGSNRNCLVDSDFLRGCLRLFSGVEDMGSYGSWALRELPCSGSRSAHSVGPY